jgi:hypothetical protein
MAPAHINGDREGASSESSPHYNYAGAKPGVCRKIVPGAMCVCIKDFMSTDYTDVTYLGDNTKIRAICVICGPLAWLFLNLLTVFPF